MSTRACSEVLATTTIIIVLIVSSRAAPILRTAVSQPTVLPYRFCKIKRRCSVLSNFAQSAVENSTILFYLAESTDPLGWEGNQLDEEVRSIDAHSVHRRTRNHTGMLGLIFDRML